MRLENKTVLLTGACGGIGSATLRRFAEEGAIMMLTDVHEPSQAFLAELKAANVQYSFYPADLSDDTQVSGLFKALVERHARLDVLVNIAGGDFGENTPLEDLDVANLQRNIDANLTSTFLTCKEAAMIMKRQKSGAIVNMSSMTFRGSSANQFAYSAAKGGVFALTRTLAMTLGKDGIRVNAVAPGMIEVDTIKSNLPPGVWEKVSTWIGSTYPLGRVGQPIEVANCILFLASDEASFVSGEVLEICGGGRL